MAATDCPEANAVVCQDPRLNVSGAPECIFKGEERPWVITLTDEAGADYLPVGEVRWTLRRELSESSLLEKESPGSGATVSGNEVTLAFATNDTAGLSDGIYVWDLWQLSPAIPLVPPTQLKVKCGATQPPLGPPIPPPPLDPAWLHAPDHAKDGSDELLVEDLATDATECSLFQVDENRCPVPVLPRVVTNPFKHVWVSAVAGAVDADGSPGKPFNPASSAGFAGPINQAWAYLSGIGIPNADAENAPRVIHLMGGVYGEDINFASTDSVIVICEGQVRVGSGSPTASEYTWTRTTQARLFSNPGFLFGLEIESNQSGGTFLLTGDIELTDFPGAPAQRIILDRATVRGIAPATINTGPQFEFKECTIRGVGVQFGGAGVLISADDVEFDGPVLMNIIRQARYCSFEQNIQVAIAASALGGFVPPTGFYGCDWGPAGGPAPTFTGPVGSAQFDYVSASTATAAGLVFAGGAGPADYY